MRCSTHKTTCASRVFPLAQSCRSFRGAPRDPSRTSVVQRPLLAFWYPSVRVRWATRSNSPTANPSATIATARCQLHEQCRDWRSSPRSRHQASLRSGHGAANGIRRVLPSLTSLSQHRCQVGRRPPAACPARLLGRSKRHECRSDTLVVPVAPTAPVRPATARRCFPILLHPPRPPPPPLHTSPPPHPYPQPLPPSPPLAPASPPPLAQNARRLVRAPALATTP